MTSEPQPDCPLCPRLVSFREGNRDAFPEWFNAPVPSFGPSDARLLIVGLAPGLRGANRTGRPFTGDHAGVLLYRTLLKYGFAAGDYAERPDDGLVMRDCLITNAVRCVPPANKPESGEINMCRQFLSGRISALPRLKAVVVLGRIAHDSAIKAFGLKLKDFSFGHGRVHTISGGKIRLYDSYHCSRYNTNTGMLTEEMFESVFFSVRNFLDSRDI
jgi:uracil-DNA glycosylase family 4